jgi:hypothetical protein
MAIDADVAALNRTMKEIVFALQEHTRVLKAINTNVLALVKSSAYDARLIDETVSRLPMVYGWVAADKAESLVKGDMRINHSDHPHGPLSIWMGSEWSKLNVEEYLNG